MGLETKIKDIKPNHFMPLVAMPKSRFEFFCFLMNEAEPSFRGYAVHLKDDTYMISPYELLQAKDSPYEGFLDN